MVKGVDMSLARSSSSYCGGGHHQLVEPYYIGMVGGSPPALGYTWMVRGSPPATGPFTQFLQIVIVVPIKGPSP